MGIKGCWTCRERKVRCDSQRPTCGNCTKARRICKGYGTQLSWPRDGDGKRALTYRNPVKALPLNVKRFLNSSFWDVALSGEIVNGRMPSHSFRSMKMPAPKYLSPIVLKREELNLIGFFKESRSLMLGPTDEEVLTQFILRTALSDSCDEANPVLQGVLALASLHLHGDAKSFDYKHHVVSAVKEPLDCSDEKTLLQKLVGLMLLYSYEVSLGFSSKDTWVVFFCAVKRIINTSPKFYLLIQQEYSVFLEWIYYHEALAEFTVRHWAKPYVGCGFAPIVRWPRAIEGPGTNEGASVACPTSVLELVVHSCRQAIVPSDFTTNDVVEDTKLLEDNVSCTLGGYGPIHVQSATLIDRKTMVSDLHRVASILYVNRAVHRVSGTEFRHRRLVREGVMLLTKMKTCQHAWPLFIIACEAVDDDQRLAIMDVFDQSLQDRRRRSSHIHVIQHLVEAVWNQHDLDEEKEVDYLTVLDSVIGGMPFMPAFV